MRDILTILAALLLLALTAALVAPQFVDWNARRVLFDRHIEAATGLQTVTTGPIAVRLLPTPRVAIGGMRLGDPAADGSRIVIENATVEIELGPLLRGEIRFRDIRLDGVDVQAVLDGATVRMPRALPDEIGGEGVALLTISRGKLTLLEPGGRVLAGAPFAVEARLPALAGPWRVEGEFAGQSLRLTTGERDGAGRIRARLAMSGASGRAEFDGWTQFLAMPSTGEARRLQLRPEGQIQASFAGETEPLLTATAQLAAQEAGIELSGISLESAGVGRIEGTGRKAAADAPLEIALQARRFDLSAMLERLPALRSATTLPPWLQALVPALSVSLGIDQLSYRGEEVNDIAVVLARPQERWQLASGRARFAGLSVSTNQVSAERQMLQIRSPDLRRFALAMQRLDMPAAVANDIASLGDIDLTAELASNVAGITAPTWRATGRFGEMQGQAHADGNDAWLNMTVRRADALALIRPVAALAQLLPGNIDMAVRAEAVTLGDSAPGEGDLSAHRRNGVWDIRTLSARGFDGLTLAITRPADRPELYRLRLDAPRALAVSALAERITDSTKATTILRALRDVSPVSLEGDLARNAGGYGLTFAGRAGPLLASGSGMLDLTRAWVSGHVELNGQRGLIFRTLGLPPPAASTEHTRFTARMEAGQVSMTLQGADGLSASAQSIAPVATPPASFQLTFDAASASSILPVFVTPGPRQPIAGTARLTLLDGALQFDDLQARSGADRIAGAVRIAANGPVTGRLSLPSLSAPAMSGWLTGPLRPSPGSWSGERFGAGVALPDLALDLESPAIIISDAWPSMAGSLRLEAAAGDLRLSRIALRTAAGQAISGNVEGERQGGQLSARANLSLRGLPVTALIGPDGAGLADLDIQVGSSGESIARLIAALNGAGTLRPQGVSLRGLDPAGLQRLTTGPDADRLIETPNALGAAVEQSLRSGDWTFSSRPLALLIAGGVVRLAPFVEETALARLSVVASHDLRGGTGELRALMALNQAPQGWYGSPPQIFAVWRGPAGQMRRSDDLGALSNALSQRALQREIERVEAFEADIRERQMFARRLRAERERRAAEERAAIEAQQRANMPSAGELPAQEPEQPAGLVPAMPPPVQIMPAPAPLQAPQGRAQPRLN